MANWILGHSPNGKAAATEKPHSPEVDALPERGTAVFALNPLNPMQLDRFSDRCSPAGAKDHRNDAIVLAHYFAIDRKVEAPLPETTRRCRTAAVSFP